MEDARPFRAAVRPSIPPQPSLAVEILGEEWMAQRLDEADKPVSARRGMTPSTIGMIDKQMRHPLISELRHIAYDKRKFPLRLYSLEMSLGQLHSALDRDSLQRRLRDDFEFEKTEYELLVGAAYSRTGMPLYSNIGERGPDYIGRAPNDQLFAIECKKKDSLTSLESRMARHRYRVDDPLIKRLDAEGLRYHLNLTPVDDPTPIDVDELIEASVALCRSTELGKTAVGDRLEVTAIKLCDPGGTVPGDVIEQFQKSRLRFLKATVDRRGSELDHTTYTDPIQVQWLLPKDHAGKVRGIENSIREAIRQIPDSGPSLVYIDINARSDWEEAEQTLRALTPAVSQMLGGAYRRINYVVLTAIFPTISRDGFEMLAVQSAVIKQPNPRSELDEAVPLLGATSGFHEHLIPGTWRGATIATQCA